MTAPEIERQERLLATAADGTTHRFYTHDEVQAAIAAAMMGAVKPLEWGGYYGRSAANPWGGYHITDREGPNQDYDWFGWTQLSRGGFDESDEDYPTIEAAKAAAQADYQARILSALSIPTDATAALEEIKRQTWNEALEAAARVSEEITTNQHIAHDIKLGMFPTQTDLRDAIAATIRAMKKEKS
jgi:hypothetical protein